MTLEELLKNKQPLGQGGASQYLTMPQYQYGAGQYLNGGLLGMPLNFNAPTNNAVQQYTTPTYIPGAWNYNKQNDFQGAFQKLANDNPNQAIWRLFALAPSSAWTKIG